MSPLALAVVVALAVALAFVNGVHDASNAISTTITTRALRERTALWYAAVLNLLGALLGGWAVAISAGWATGVLWLDELFATVSPQQLGFALTGILLATLLWLLATLRLGMPASTWHSVFGAVAGAVFALGAHAPWTRLMLLVALPILVGPLVAAAASFVVMRILLALGRTERLRVAHMRFLQTTSAGLVAAGHGLHDVRVPLALIAAAAACTTSGAEIAVGATIPVAVALALGTALGGHRIIRTLGRRVSDLSTAQGLAAETMAAAVVGLAVFGLKVPVSTSHTLAAGVVGAGSALGPRHVRWTVVGQMLVTWFATSLVTGLLSGVITILQMRLL